MTAFKVKTFACSCARLLEQLAAMPLTARLAPPPLWRSELERYFTSVPQYYCAPLKALLLSILIAWHISSAFNSLLWVPGWVACPLAGSKAGESDTRNSMADGV